MRFGARYSPAGPYCTYQLDYCQLSNIFQAGANFLSSKILPSEESAKNRSKLGKLYRACPHYGVLKTIVDSHSYKAKRLMQRLELVMAKLY